MQPNQPSNSGIIIKTIAGIVVLGLAGFAFSRMDKTAEQVADTGSLPASSTEPVATPPNRTTIYKNGTYNATGRYTSPARQEEVAIILVIKDDVVVSGTFTGKAVNPTSIKNQTLFKEGFNRYVVGKGVDSLKLQVVNGSSLTPKGFMDALVKIKTEAKV